MEERDPVITVTSEAFSLGLCQLPPESSQVVDADEEVFFLYTSVASRNVQDSAHAFRGLGYLDSHQDVLTLEFPVQVEVAETIHEVDLVTHGSHGHRHAKRKKRKAPEEKTLQVQLAQDKTALRSRKGDTGSVLWRASMEFAQLVLRQWYSRTPNSLFHREKLSEAHVLELGAGTGLLSIVLSPLVQHYTATDIAELVPLIAKNLALNDIPREVPTTRTPDRTPRSVTVEALDWIVAHEAWSASPHTLISYPDVDLLLAVDCIYHPSLLPALVDTIDHLTIPGRTTVLVMVELRAEDVIREFLQLWLAADAGSWEIWHAQEVMEGPYAVWVGRKRPPRDVA